MHVPEMGFTVATKEQNVGRQQLYNDINGDREVFTIFARSGTVRRRLRGFQPRDPHHRGATPRDRNRDVARRADADESRRRPLLVATEIALLGAVLGVGVGLLINTAFLSLMQSWIPLPMWRTRFEASIFLRGAALGFFLPLLATVYPIMRAVRVTPIEAIRTGLPRRSGAAESASPRDSGGSRCRAGASVDCRSATSRVRRVGAR